ncbi:unnamed protein product, partial [Prorocentrum cordatum]
EELLGPAEDREARSRTLQDALKARAAAARAAGDADLADQGVRPAFAEYRLTPASADPRRPEIVGKLPIERIRADLGKLLTESQVVVVSGGTGSGKSTQLPQFLLDDWRGQDDAAVEPTAGAPRIVVTQPRRIAAISVAERVAWERGEQIGESVGYAVYGSAVRPKLSSGSVEFVTVGTLLRRAVSDPLLQRYDVVVVDEVHERDMLTDFLLILLRELMMQRPRLRLVLMSATMDMGSFADYFRSCPVLEKGCMEWNVRSWAVTVASSAEVTLCVLGLRGGSTTTALMAFMDSVGLRGEYDFLYAPSDFRSKRGFGYAIANFLSSSAAKRFVQLISFGGLSKFAAGSDIRVTPSKTQGLAECLLSWYRSHSRSVRSAKLFCFVRPLNAIMPVNPYLEMPPSIPRAMDVPIPAFSVAGSAKLFCFVRPLTR